MTTLYKITNLTKNGNSFGASVTFNPSHPVFSGHFPGQPVVPGVVLVEITAVVISKLTGKDLIVKEASVIKFLRVIDPMVNTDILVDGTVIETDKDHYKADLGFASGETVFAKLKGIKLHAKP